MKLAAETQLVSKDQGTFAKMLHFKHCTERVCVDVPLLTRPGEHLSTYYRAGTAQAAHGDGSI